MKNVGIVCAALVVALMASSAVAADAIANSTLASMGLGGMQQLSDNEGMTVRGLGYRGHSGSSASVWGESSVNYKGQTAVNGYEASSKHKYGGSEAGGKNISVAGTVDIKYSSRHGLYVKASLGVAGGASTAWAK